MFGMHKHRMQSGFVANIPLVAELLRRLLLPSTQRCVREDYSSAEWMIWHGQGRASCHCLAQHARPSARTPCFCKLEQLNGPWGLRHGHWGWYPGLLVAAMLGHVMLHGQGCATPPSIFASGWHMRNSLVLSLSLSLH